jgi:hypothetical protein
VDATTAGRVWVVAGEDAGGDGRDEVGVVAKRIPEASGVLETLTKFSV